MDDLGYERFAPKTGNEPTAENKSSTALEHKEESLNEGEVVNQELKTEETPKSVETSDKLIGNADNILPADVNAKTETENKLNPDTSINKETKVNANTDSVSEAEAARRTAEIKYYTEKTEKRKRTVQSTIFAIVTVLLIAIIGFQTIYIYKLNTAKVGLMTYDNEAYRSSKEKDKSDKKNNKVKDILDNANVVDPHFSLEEAASVTDPNKETLSISEIASKLMPATVSIYIVDAQNPKTILASGSGFVISEDGYVVTNKHVVVDALKSKELGIRVHVPGDEDTYVADIVGTDEQTDIAVVKLKDAKNMACVTLGDSDMLQIGELAVAIGNPLGSFESTVTVGVISATSREINTNGYTVELLQTDASINSGNSGGPLINSFGEVIGVTNAKISSAEGLGFAIPINSVKNVIESIINIGYVAGRPTLGVMIRTVSEGDYYGAEPGLYVEELTPDGPAERAGMEVGDKIISFDGIEIKESSDIMEVRDSHDIGDAVSIEVMRDGDILKLEIVIGESADYEH